MRRAAACSVEANRIAAGIKSVAYAARRLAALAYATSQPGTAIRGVVAVLPHGHAARPGGAERVAALIRALAASGPGFDAALAAVAVRGRVAAVGVVVAVAVDSGGAAASS